MLAETEPATALALPDGRVAPAKLAVIEPTKPVRLASMFRLLTARFEPAMKASVRLMTALALKAPPKATELCRPALVYAAEPVTDTSFVSLLALIVNVVPVSFGVALACS